MKKLPPYVTPVSSRPVIWGYWLQSILLTALLLLLLRWVDMLPPLENTDDSADVQRQIEAPQVRQVRSQHL